MPDQHQIEALRLLKHELNSLGYVGNLIREDYEFADVLSNDIAVNQIPLAAFAQDPPSYRNAAFGVAIANGHSGAEFVQTYRSLGAPQIFEVNNDRVLRWKVSSNSSPSLLDNVNIEQLGQVFAQHKTAWVPQRILHAKSNVSQAVQLDFFDVGLLPLLEHETRIKLDSQLKGTVAVAIDTFERRSKFTDDLYPQLFRLIFRLIAAKILTDRRHPGNWNPDDAKSALQAVEGFYYRGDKAEPALEDNIAQQKTWEWIKQVCHFQNLSVDSLAYVYENTLVTQETRKAYGTHSTPYAVAEYIVRNLPFESLDQNERSVFEPFSGHSIFLVAAMQRLRELLPSQISPSDRHKYFVRMLAGIEYDEFALEVSKLSLMLADYPNPDGWRLHKADVFDSPTFGDELSRSNIVLCNPPFERFSKEEKTAYGGFLSTTKAAEALRRVLEKPPQLLGFVLPRVFVEGREYRQLRARLGEIYSSFDLLVLPDRVFQHSAAETVVLLSSNRHTGPKSLAVGQVLNSDLQDFYSTQSPKYRREEIVEQPSEKFSNGMWLAPLKEVWTTFSNFATLGTHADIHRGIEYNQPLGPDGSNFVSKIAHLGYRAGLHRARGATEPFVVTSSVYLDMSERFMRGSAYQSDWNAPKLIVNANPKPTGNWKITASIDRSGLVCYQNFHAIWPKSKLPLEVLAAILNGPVANAFVSTRSSKRHVHIETLSSIPIPEFSKEQTLSLVSLVRRYVDTRKKWLDLELEDQRAKVQCLDLISRIDAEVLKAYGLAPQHERELLDWFRGSKRLGPVEFTEYFPRTFAPVIPWHRYIDDGSSAELIPPSLSQRTLLFNELQADFIAAPVEDGMEHEAERTLVRVLSDGPEEEILYWIREFCTDVARPSFASSVLRCLASLNPPGTGEWRVDLVQDALQSNNVDIKEAAIQAVEHWGDAELVEVLASHQEDVVWLREYIAGVVKDLGE